MSEIQSVLRSGAIYCSVFTREEEEQEQEEAASSRRAATATAENVRNTTMENQPAAIDVGGDVVENSGTAAAATNADVNDSLFPKGDSTRSTSSSSSLNVVKEDENMVKTVTTEDGEAQEEDDERQQLQTVANTR